MQIHIRRALFFAFACVVLVGIVDRASAQPAYIAGTWGDDAIHLLDSNLNNLSSFPTGSGLPNGTASDGTRIYSGHFTTNEVIAYNFSGVEQFRWSAPLSNLQGMDFVNGALAIQNGSQIEYRNPLNGAFLGAIPSVGGTIEGLAFDGVYLWQLDDTVIYASDPATGTIIYTIPNPAVNSNFGGTGLAASVPGRLTVAADNGNWWKVNSVSGAILSSGNNGLSMYALTEVPGIPEPASIIIAALTGVFALAHPIRRRLN